MHFPDVIPGGRREAVQCALNLEAQVTCQRDYRNCKPLVMLYFLVPHRFHPESGNSDGMAPESVGMGLESTGMRPELPESAGMRLEWLNSTRMPPEFIMREGLRQYQNHLIGHI